LKSRETKGGGGGEIKEPINKKIGFILWSWENVTGVFPSEQARGQKKGVTRIGRGGNLVGNTDISRGGTGGWSGGFDSSEKWPKKKKMLGGRGGGVAGMSIVGKKGGSGFGRRDRAPTPYHSHRGEEKRQQITKKSHGILTKEASS